MHWYNLLLKRFLFFATGIAMMLGGQSCKNNSNAGKGALKYFDLKGFFEASAARLNRLNPTIDKTVVHNKVSENKKVHISNWEDEFSSFIESDINKPTWRSSYNVDSSANALIYRAKDPLLKTQEIVIRKENGKVKWIMILNHSKNTIFKKVFSETMEKLSYFPDSLYQIVKLQRVRLSGTNKYRITGAFNYGGH